MYIFGNTPGISMEGIASLCCNVLICFCFCFFINAKWFCIYFRGIIYHVKFFTELSQQFGNSRHCFPDSLLMCKCHSALCSDLFSCFVYFSLLTGKKLAFTPDSRTEALGQSDQRPVATTSVSNTPLPSLPWENQLQNWEGDFRCWIFAPLLPARIHL